MATPLTLSFETNQKDLYTKVGNKKKTPAFPLDDILGNDNGQTKWGWQAISLSARGLTIVNGHTLKAELATTTREWKKVELDLRTHIRYDAQKNILEPYDLPRIEAAELKALQAQKAALIEIANAEKLRAEAAEKEAQAAKELAEKAKHEAEVAKKDAEITKKEKAEAEKTFEDWKRQEEVQDKLVEEVHSIEIQERLRKEKELQAIAAQREALHVSKEAELEGKLVQVAHKAELVVGEALSKAEMEEAREITTAFDRLQIEEQLSKTEKRIAEQDTVISSRFVNLGRTYGDYAHLNGEIKERDLKMSLMFQDQSDMYRELSFAHERFSGVDMERLAMKEEQKRVISRFASLQHKFDTTFTKLERVEAEYRKQEAELKHTVDERSRFESKCIRLESEIDELRRENMTLKTLTVDLKAERTAIRAKFENAQTIILGQEVVIKHSEAWKALYDQQVLALRKDLADVNIAMAHLEESYQNTAKAFRTAWTEKEKLQSELIEVKISKTAVEARVVVIEQALQASRAELSQLSKSYEEKDDELRAVAGVKAVLERRLSELSLTHSHERNVTRSLSERLVHVQGNMAENVDWMYDMRQDLSDESKYLYLHYLHNGGAAGLGLKTPPLGRLPSYRSAVNSAAGSPDKKGASIVEKVTEAVEVKVAAQEFQHANGVAVVA
ncbi:hypothetical protein CALVIDRAFT_565522 [Calocera viscosa TUFC12733]|uniref:Uncharacterized protein n=1 Tax=Calocera viscosa (strain TUFC12733) TaxID=1330018 RepID=A0A167KAK7_CALVF|nr:hypothetical protein CALVIDRAFT_565522 [Calocera viscosa TUFC12733]